MNQKTKVVNIIKEILADEGRSQRWLAKKIGIHYTTLNGYVNNDSQPTADVLFKIAKALNRTTDSLLKEVPAESE